MSKSSKNKGTDITKFLPEVFKSDVNQSVFDVAFNRHLSKDDTSRVVGYVGESNARVIVNRKIAESTPHRQAFQLAPTMVTSVGTVDSALSFKAFQNQLDLMGVDISKMDKWAKTTSFNWIPPINLDMLINYQDYFWKPSNPLQSADYLTIENRCSKAKSKVGSYSNVISTYGSLFAVTAIDIAENAFVVDLKRDDLFASGFVFFTKNTNNVNLSNTYWTVASATFDSTANATTIKVIEPIASITQPVSPFIGTWWNDAGVLREWNGSTWPQVAPVVVVDISLEELLTTYQSEANCICSQDYGWDVRPWDDNQVGNVVWNEALFSTITAATESQWLAMNGSAVAYDLWYDTTTNTLKQRDVTNTEWKIVVRNMSSIKALSTGATPWDSSTECSAQKDNQWTTSNKWVHKTEVQSFAGVTRAQVPILEYDSLIELNEWTKVVHGWKYRADIDSTFTSLEAGISPSRLELEPIKGYALSNIAGEWYIYLADVNQPDQQLVDFTSTFKPGYRFRVTDDATLSEVYTVASSVYRLIDAFSDSDVTGTTGSGLYATVIKLVEANVTIPVTGGGFTNTRIEPIITSQAHPWKGYHIHWLLDEAATFSSPSANVRTTLPLEQESVTLVAGDPSYSYFSPQVPSVTVGFNYQELTVTDANTTVVSLHKKFNRGYGNGPLTALVDTIDLRVYVNGVRQYGTYTELFDTATVDYEVIGHSVYQGTTSFKYVTGVQFATPLKQYDNVRIEVGPAAFVDLGYGNVSVRTIEDEQLFAIAAAEGTQPAHKNLTQYQLIQQVKSQANQYPLFNVYDVITSEVVKTSPLFTFLEDSTAAVSSAVQRRIVRSSDGREFTFQQHLLDRDDNIIYAFHRQVPGASPYWYNPNTKTVAMWDGYAWNTTYDNGRGFITVPQQPTQPSFYNDGALWLNSLTTKLFKYDGNLGTWTQQTLTISTTDPYLQTVWRKGAVNNYTPAYVDKDKNPIVVGSSDGDWEVLSQWKNNADHQNKSQVKYSQLITHFSSIIAGQEAIPGLLNGGAYTRMQQEYNYGVGGTIKEHNGSFDTLISAVNVSSITPISVIEFAEREYASAITSLSESFINVAIEYLVSTDRKTCENLNLYIVDQLLAHRSSNDYVARIYGDSTAYDKVTGKGVKNWIATSPMIGLTELVRPHVNHDGDNSTVYHHDGHRSEFLFTAAELDRLARRSCATIDARTNTPQGIVSSLQPPSTRSAFEAAFGGALRSSVFWYTVSGSTRKLYRFQAYELSSTAPSLFDSDGSEISDGAMYYDIVGNTVYMKDGLAWVEHSIVGSSDVSPLWQEVNPAVIIAETVYAIEQSLYDVTITPPVHTYNFNTVRTDSRYAALMKQRFDAFVMARSIQTPLVNVEYSATDPFTWNYSKCLISSTPKLSSTNYQAGSWQALYNLWYNTPYPHLEPWKLQGYKDKPTWWDAEYKEINGTRRWKYNHATLTGMWQNIRVGRVPSGRTYPDGTTSSGNTLADGKSLPSYAYFSVNISNATIVGGYEPDDVLPPYFDNASIAITLPTVRSLYNNYNVQVIAPDADYVYGDNGPTEWAWKTSSQYPYDIPVVAFQIDPVNFLHAFFGPTYVTIDSLDIETLFKQVYSHTDALFHGDIYDGDKSYTSYGLNQWYVNVNRASSIDTNGEFRQQWVGWAPKLTYQFGGIVDTESCDVTNRYFDVIPQDFNILLANNGVVDDIWAEAFEISALTIPPSTIQYNNESAWKFEIDVLAAIPRTLEYYGVRQYTFDVDVTTNVCTAFSYTVTSILPSANEIDVKFDATAGIQVGDTFVLTGAGSNNGSYTVTDVTYLPSLNSTRIIVNTPFAVSGSAGTIRLTSKALPWMTGDVVVISSTSMVPHGIYASTPYYIIRDSATTFRLAESRNDALIGNAINLTTVGVGQLKVAQIQSSFLALGGNNSGETWFHFEPDLTIVHKLTPPAIIYGMQNLINIIDGYSELQGTTNLRIGTAEESNFDPDTGRLTNWQLETERFIDWAYGLRATRLIVADKYDVSVNATDNTLTFTGSVPMWISGTPITVASTGLLPSPLIDREKYYVVQTGTEGTIRLSLSTNAADTGAWIDFTTQGSGVITVSKNAQVRSFPTFELNPLRRGVTVATPTGVLSNVITGPYADIRIQQTLYDQYSRPLLADKLMVYRNDKSSRIVVRDQLFNDVQRNYTNDPYGYLHVGGGHFFVEGYEHFLIFNDYTVGGSLIYDQFLGLSARKFNLDYYEKSDYDLQPTLGGYYLLDQEFKRNMEGSTDDLRYMYDSLTLNEASLFASRARGLLGYQGRSTFLDMVNMNRKSQFMFYKGMIQSKGSVNSVKAFVNSRRFVDAKLDEFWAWKIAEFGDARPRMYPEVNLTSADGSLDDVRLEFLTKTEATGDDGVAESIKQGFQMVSFNDESRWNNFPEQRDELGTALFLDADVGSTVIVYSNTTAPTPNMEGVTHWYKSDTQRLYQYDADALSWSIDVTSTQMAVDTILLGNPATATDVVYFKHPVSCDDVRVLHRTFINGDYNNYTTDIFNPGVGTYEYTRIDSETIRFNKAGVTDLLIIQTLLPAFAKLSPAKLIDKKSSTIVSTLPIWDPARGQHYPNAIYNVDLQSKQDPARYSLSVNPTLTSTNFWNASELDTVWLDTEQLGYMPYYDDTAYSDINDRLYNWGKLAPWSSMKVYKWTQSPVPPAEWADLVIAHAKDSSIPQNDKASGTARETTFKRVRETAIGTVDLVDNTITAALSFAQDDVVLFTSSDTLPTPLESATKYVVTNIVGNTFQVMDSITEELIVLEDAGVGTLTVVPAFKAQSWVRQSFSRVRIPATLLAQHIVSVVGPVAPYAYPRTLPVPYILWQQDASNWTATVDVVDVYINGVLSASGLTVKYESGADLWYVEMPAPFIVQEHDVIDVVRPVVPLSDEEIDFNPDAIDDGTIHTQRIVSYDYSSTTVNNGNNVIGDSNVTTYYFWVEGSTNRPTNKTPALSVAEVARQLVDIPTPYVTLQKPKDEPVLMERYGYGMTEYGATFSLGAMSDQFYQIPVTYRQAIIRRVASYLDDDNRYIIRFTRDLSLRDEVRSVGDNKLLKNKHEEWFMFRKEQTSSIPEELWNRLVESMIGHKLDDDTIRVPTLERELYDAKYGTDTRYGLGEDQAFVDRNLAVATVIQYLQDPSKDFSPIDIDDFFNQHSFDTSENILKAMNAIYGSFNSVHINSIWFETLSDALSTKSKYKELMKTSWIALHGIRVLEVGGLFDD